KYITAMLDIALEKEKSIFEYWSHAASYLPMRDYRYSLVRKKNIREGSTAWFSEDLDVQSSLLTYIRENGAVQSNDFDHDHSSQKKGGWWSWKPTKKALEHLFMKGDLMIARREGFRKIYDIPERVLPSDIDTTFPTPQEYLDYCIYSTINAQGLASIDDMTHLRSASHKKNIQKRLDELLRNTSLIPVEIESLNQLYYSTADILAEHIPKNKKRVHILSPFDNLIIRRKKVKEIFNFDYTIECYVPEHKRVYGYFSLPILYGTEFIGRIDCKAERKNQIFIIKGLFPEGQRDKEELYRIIEPTLYNFALWNGCQEIQWQK
ncbi:MAG TPA: crosslink repair DNA glycosylase YcaQ family protein, partial [Candidatus Kapabacteria bacterium]|nr:crosslink repair DNA glycosylase YcaQ family protein [Candidatus Kapabacteria bacterium]